MQSENGGYKMLSDDFKKCMDYNLGDIHPDVRLVLDKVYEVLLQSEKTEKGNCQMNLWSKGFVGLLKHKFPPAFNGVLDKALDNNMPIFCRDSNGVINPLNWVEIIWYKQTGDNFVIAHGIPESNDFNSGMLISCY